MREIYRDSITGKKEWGLVQAPEGGIMGVYTLANGVRQKVGNFSEQYIEFENSSGYLDWKFIYRPDAPASIK